MRLNGADKLLIFGIRIRRKWITSTPSVDSCARPGLDTSPCHRQRTGTHQARIAIFLTFQLWKSRILRDVIPRPVAGLSAPREDAVHSALDPAASLSLVPSNIERGVFEQGIAVVKERYLRVVQMVVNPQAMAFHDMSGRSRR